MRSDPRKYLIFAALAAALLAGVVRAQEAAKITRLNIPASDSGEAYSASVRLGRIETDLYYVDTLEGEIPLGKPPELSVPPEAPEFSGDTNWKMLTIFGAILVALVFLIVRSGGGFGALSVRQPGDRKRTRGQNGGKSAQGNEESAGLEGVLAEIDAMPDRRAALVLLLRHSLQQAARVHDLRLARSETAREIVHRLPDRWVHLAALRKLVMAEELVQFGGRALAEATFKECLGIATPILRGAR